MLLLLLTIPMYIMLFTKKQLEHTISCCYCSLYPCSLKAITSIAQENTTTKHHLFVKYWFRPPLNFATISQECELPKPNSITERRSFILLLNSLIRSAYIMDELMSLLSTYPLTITKQNSRGHALEHFESYGTKERLIVRQL